MEKTIETRKTVGEIAAENPAAASVFEKYGIDFCCGGKKPLADVCQAQGVAMDALARDLETAISDRPAGATDWASAPLSALIDHIVRTHHAFLKDELPALEARMEKVLNAHGERVPYLERLAVVYAGVSAELSSHLMKEEMVLFPHIKRMEEAHDNGRGPVPVPFGTVQNPIRMMEHEHDSAGTALAEMRSLTAGYAIPEGVCNTFRALFFGLERLERDLHTHIHLENNILFPRAARMEMEGR